MTKASTRWRPSRAAVGRSRTESAAPSSGTRSPRRPRAAPPRDEAAPSASRRPAVLLGLDDVVDEHQQAGGDRGRAGDVERLGGRSSARVSRCTDREDEGDDPDREVDEENPAPRDGSVRRPPSSRPNAPPPAAIALQIPSACVRSVPSANVVMTIDSAAGETSAAPRPCRPRPPISMFDEVREAVQQRGSGEDGEARMNRRWRPKRSEARPPSSRKPPKNRV